MSIESFILIGGASSRFGSPKALMTLRGTPVLVKLADMIADVFPGKMPTVVAANDSQQLPAGLDLPFIIDFYPGRGPLSGLHAALAFCQSEWAFVAACDYPFLTSQLLSRLHEMTGDDTDAVVPIQADGRPQPLCAFYRREVCLPAVEEMVTASRPAPPLKAVLERVRTREVAFAEIADLEGSNRFFTNVNTQADLERL